MKKVNDEIITALNRTAEALSLTEISHRTGLKLSMLQRFMNRRTGYLRQETLSKLYPFVRPYLLLKTADSTDEMPARIGDEPRIGHYLDILESDEKVLIDVYSALPELEQCDILREWQAGHPGVASAKIAELSDRENALLGIFQSMDKDAKQLAMMPIVFRATEEMRHRREMF